MDLGFDGLFVEAHGAPDTAWSDRDQQIAPEALGALLRTLKLRETHAAAGELGALRAQIDRIDDELLELLDRRMKVACEIGRYKKEHSMPVIQAGRYNDLMERRVRSAEEMGMSPEFMRAVLAAIHEESVRKQIEIVNGHPLGK